MKVVENDRIVGDRNTTIEATEKPWNFTKLLFKGEVLNGCKNSKMAKLTRKLIRDVNVSTE